MKNFFKGKNIVFNLIYFFLYISIINAKYKEIELKLKKGETDYDFPLYIETNDSCSRWVPALFSPILIINKDINSDDYSSKFIEINIQNPDSIKNYNKPLDLNIFSYNVSVFNEIYIAKSIVSWPKYCRFGLDYSEVNAKNKNINSIKNLIPTQIEKNIFSFGKWDLNKSDNIYSKFYIGDSHENFLKDVGTCNIQKEANYFGCIFNDFIFLNKT